MTTPDDVRTGLAVFVIVTYLVQAAAVVAIAATIVEGIRDLWEHH